MKFLSIRITFLAAITMCTFNMVKGQGFSENALLFSRTTPGGSARIQSLGGAQISLGGDYSSGLSNPAGLGMFNHSEFTFSPGFNILNTTANFQGNSNATNKAVVTIPGLSLVLHHASDNKGFLGGSFGVTMSRTNDLNQNYSYDGKNDNSSIINYFLYNSYDEKGNGLNPNSMIIDKNGNPGANFYNITALAYNNFLTQDYTNTNRTVNYSSPLLAQQADPANNTPQETRTERQKEIIQRKGSQYQWSIAYGGNFSDKLFFGVSVGLTSLKYNLAQSYSESNFSFSNDASYNPLNNFRVDETLNIRGSGVNLTTGLIYKPTNQFQVGMSIVTPTYYQITDTYNATVSSAWNNFDYYGDGKTILNSVTQSFDTPLVSNYSLTTPFKFSMGATGFIGKYGFITADAEFVNYSKANYADNSASGISYSDNNNDIHSDYKPVVNYRIGGEFRYELLRLRLGYNIQADPYRINDSLDRKIQNLSGGIGIKQKKYSIDFTTVYSQSNNRRIPYSVPGLPDPVAKLQLNNMNFICTVGFTF